MYNQVVSPGMEVKYGVQGKEGHLKKGQLHMYFILLCKLHFDKNSVLNYFAIL